MRKHDAVDRTVVIQKHLDVHGLRRLGRGSLVGVALGSGRIGRRTASHRLHDHPRRDALVGQHQRSMRALVEEETGGEAAGPFDVDDVGFAVRRFRFTAVDEFEWH